MLLSELCFSKTVMEISLIRSKFCDLIFHVMPICQWRPHISACLVCKFAPNRCVGYGGTLFSCRKQWINRYRLQ